MISPAPSKVFWTNKHIAVDLWPVISADYCDDDRLRGQGAPDVDGQDRGVLLRCLRHFLFCTSCGEWECPPLVYATCQSYHLICCVQSCILIPSRCRKTYIFHNNEVGCVLGRWGTVVCEARLLPFPCCDLRQFPFPHSGIPPSLPWSLTCSVSCDGWEMRYLRVIECSRHSDYRLI